jgi:hypothetical protein
LTSHRADEGPVTLVDDDELHATASSRLHATGNQRSAADMTLRAYGSSVATATRMSKEEDTAQVHIFRALSGRDLATYSSGIMPP